MKGASAMMAPVSASIAKHTVTTSFMPAGYSSSVAQAAQIVVRASGPWASP
jgi:hypothetical protein